MTFIGRALGFSGNSPTVAPAAAAPTREDPAVAAAARAETVASGKLRGAAANLLTGGTDLGQAPVSKKYLTGQ